MAVLSVVLLYNMWIISITVIRCVAINYACEHKGTPNPNQTESDYSKLFCNIFSNNCCR